MVFDRFFEKFLEIYSNIYLVSNKCNRIIISGTVMIQIKITYSLMISDLVNIVGKRGGRGAATNAIRRVISLASGPSRFIVPGCYAGRSVVSGQWSVVSQSGIM